MTSSQGHLVEEVLAVEKVLAVEEVTLDLRAMEQAQLQRQTAEAEKQKAQEQKQIAEKATTRANEEKKRAKKLGITNFEQKYNIDDMIKGDVIFCASGVTNGDLAEGVQDLGNKFKVTTFALHKSKKINKIFTNIYKK